MSELSRDDISSYVLFCAQSLKYIFSLRNTDICVIRSRYIESLFIWTCVYDRSNRIMHCKAQIRMLKGEWCHVAYPLVYISYKGPS